MVTLMVSVPSETERDWRLKAQLDRDLGRGVLESLVRRLHGPDVTAEVKAQVPADVVITHDGELLFAYAASEQEIRAVRAAVESVLRSDSIVGQLQLSHWDERLDKWLQTDPPLGASEQLTEEAAERDAEAVETRTLVASSGKLIRAEFERSMSTWADQLGIECKIVEHPHLLRTQVAFTVTGPRRKIDEFSKGLIAEGWMTIRTEETVMLSPL
jgi:hypothetical protein